MQIWIDASEKWKFKDWCHLQGLDMREVGGQIVTAFNHVPDAWFQAMLVADEQRVPLGELLGPIIAAFSSDPDTWCELMAAANEMDVPLGELLMPYLEQALSGEGSE